MRDKNALDRDFIAEARFVFCLRSTQVSHRWDPQIPLDVTTAVSRPVAAI